MRNRVAVRGGLFFECIGFGEKKPGKRFTSCAEPEVYVGYLIWKNLPVDKGCSSARLIYKPICSKGFTIQFVVH